MVGIQLIHLLILLQVLPLAVQVVHIVAITRHVGHVVEQAIASIVVEQVTIEYLKITNALSVKAMDVVFDAMVREDINYSETSF